MWQSLAYEHLTEHKKLCTTCSEYHHGHFFETKFGHMSTKQKQLCYMHFLRNPFCSTKSCLLGLTSMVGALEFIVDVDVIDHDYGERLKRQTNLLVGWLIDHCHV